MPNIIERVLTVLKGGKGDMPTPGRVRNAYMRGGRHTVFNNWQPPLRSEQSNRGQAWDLAVSRTADAIHNSGWLSGAIEQAKANTVGTGLRVRPAPDNASFGMSDDEATKWAADVRRRWELWATTPLECDVAGLRTIYQMQAEVFGSWIATGEVLSEILTRRRSVSTSLTKVRLMMPTRISRRSDPANRLINGVYVDQDGMPIALLARGSNPLSMQDVRIPIRDGYGRPRVIHVFTGSPETYRGITPLAPALQVIRQFDTLSDATLTAATVQTIFAASIKSPEASRDAMAALMDSRELAEYERDGGSALEASLEASGAYYEGAQLDLGVSGRINRLFPGEEMDFHSPANPSDNYGAYSADLKREFARCLGMMYESATGDYSNATYASLGRGLAEIHEVTKARRAAILLPWTKPVYDAWLEEQIETGQVDFPGGINGFLKHRAAATRIELAGGQRPIAEDLKTAKAHQIWLDLGVASRSDIAAELGRDYGDVVLDLAAEASQRESAGVPEPGTVREQETEVEDGNSDD